mmetsp:Transcript_19528/g.54488  ORF Transcript_19528/g.54488 Transcript_19528/m.54488 type:complete len:216 (-) Transcript_19528:1806-2453(-)
MCSFALSSTKISQRSACPCARSRHSKLAVMVSCTRSTVRVMGCSEAAMERRGKAATQLAIWAPAAGCLTAEPMSEALMSSSSIRPKPLSSSFHSSSGLSVCSNWRRGWESGHSLCSMHLHKVRQVSAKLLHLRLRAISNTALRIRGALVAMYIMSATRLNDSTRARLTEAWSRIFALPCLFSIPPLTSKGQASLLSFSTSGISSSRTIIDSNSEL